MPIKSLQSCPTLCNSMDCTLQGSSVHGILQAKDTGVGCHSLLQGNLPDPEIEQASLMSPSSACRFFTTSTTWEDIKWGQPTLNTLSHFFAKNFTFWMPQALAAACEIFIVNT